MTCAERPILFDCQGDRLVGILAIPGRLACMTGVIIIVGGPQYRAGSHRQFTLLARSLAIHGIVSLRFDTRGMGDSEGDARSFTALDDDIRAAIDTLLREVPRLTGVALWGLCDAASAAMMYACQDARVSKLVLLNPWVHTDGLAARARLNHYYGRQLLRRELWRKLFSGQIDWTASLRDVVRSLRSVIEKQFFDTPRSFSSGIPQEGANPSEARGFIVRMLRCFERFEGHSLIILSGNDLTAQEFLTLTHGSKAWQRVLRRTNGRIELMPGANHTFASCEWRLQVECETNKAISST